MITDGQVTRIQVSADDITAGVPREGCLCPIALALCRALQPVLGDGWWTVEVAGTTSIFGGDGERMAHADLPDAAQAFIRRFDNEEDPDLQPFEFDVTWEAAS